MSRPRLVLIDGSSYLYRAFHALPPLTNSAGEPTGALFGVVNMLRATLNAKPDYAAFVQDAPGRTFRDDLYAEYKANREAMPDPLAAQVTPMLTIVEALGFPILRVEGVEADDVIGTLAIQAAEQGIDVVVSTGDKDFAQLVRPGVQLVNTMSNTTLDEAGVVEKFGVPPNRIVDMLALMGDSIDNIPGVEKVGPKTAVKWLAQYGSLENLLAHADEVTGTVGENLRKARDWLPQARRLVTVKRDLELPSKVEELTHRPSDKARLAELFDRFEFRAWRRELGETPPPEGARSAPIAQTGEYTAILRADELTAWLGKIDSVALTAVNAETTGCDPMTAALVGIALSVEPGKGAYLPLAHCYTGAPEQLPFDTTLARVKQCSRIQPRPRLRTTRSISCTCWRTAGSKSRGWPTTPCWSRM